MAPSRSRPASSGLGRWTFSTRSAPSASAASASRAPAASYWASGKPAAAPAPRSHDELVARLLQAADRLRDERHAALAGGGLERNSDAHPCPFTLRHGRRRGREGLTRIKWRRASERSTAPARGTRRRGVTTQWQLKQP